MTSRITSSRGVRASLDTHAFLWFTTGEPGLSNAARELITNPRNEILLGLASLWEVAIKASLGNSFCSPLSTQRF